MCPHAHTPDKIHLRDEEVYGTRRHAYGEEMEEWVGALFIVGLVSGEIRGFAAIK